MAEFKEYRKTAITEIAPWDESFDMSRVEVSKEDIEAGHPLPGDMIARDPNNRGDQWLISGEYFINSYEPIN